MSILDIVKSSFFVDSTPSKLLIRMLLLISLLPFHYVLNDPRVFSIIKYVLNSTAEMLLVLLCVKVVTWTLYHLSLPPSTHLNEQPFY